MVDDLNLEARRGLGEDGRVPGAPGPAMTFIDPHAAKVGEATDIPRNKVGDLIADGESHTMDAFAGQPSLEPDADPEVVPEQDTFLDDLKRVLGLGMDLAKHEIVPEIERMIALAPDDEPGEIAPAVEDLAGLEPKPFLEGTKKILEALHGSIATFATTDAHAMLLNALRDGLYWIENDLAQNHG